MLHKTKRLVACLGVCVAAFFNTAAAQSALSLHGDVPLHISNTTVRVNGNVNIDTAYSGLIDSESGILRVTGSWHNHNDTSITFVRQSHTVELVGSALQQLSGPTAFHHLVLNNSNGATIVSGAPTVYGSLTLANGTLTTNDSLVIGSDATGTGRIAELSGGAISGGIQAERYLPVSDTAGWRMLSLPCDSQSLAQLDDDFVTTGFPGSDYPSYAFTSAYLYDETVLDVVDSGWVAPTNINTLLDTGQGFIIFLNGGPLRFSVWGNPDTGTISLPVTYSNTGDSADDGWNLVGNPYPSPIDWDSPNWTKTNIANAIYVWDHAARQYAAYVDGVGTNGGSRFLPSFQGFWVQTVDANPTLTIRESVKVDNAVGLLQAAPISGLLRLKLWGSGPEDETVIRFLPGAAQDFEAEVDARKVGSLDAGALFIASSLQGTTYAVNTIGTSELPDTIPLVVSIPYEGPATIAFSEVPVLPAGYCLQLLDKELDLAVDLTQWEEYWFVNSSATTTNRFALAVCRPQQISPYTPGQHGESPDVAEPEVPTGIENSALASLRVYPIPATQTLFVEANNAIGEELTISLTDGAGRVVWTQRGTAALPNSIDVAGLARGVYTLKVEGVAQRPLLRSVVLK